MAQSKAWEQPKRTALPYVRLRSSDDIKKPNKNKKFYDFPKLQLPIFIRTEKTEKRNCIDWKKEQFRICTILAFLAFGISFFTLSVLRTGLEVVMDGRSIGCVETQGVVMNSLDNVQDAVENILGHPYAVPNEISYRFTVINRNKLFNQAQFEDSILSDVPEIKRLYVLSVDGEEIGAMQSQKELETVLGELLGKNGTPLNVRFDTPFSIERKLTSANLQKQHDELANILSRPIASEIRYTLKDGDTLQSIADDFGVTKQDIARFNKSDDIYEGASILVRPAVPLLSVAYDIEGEELEPISFEAEEIIDEHLFEGETRIVQEGIEGEQKNFILTAIVNGYEEGKTVVNTEIITPPTTQIIAKGTRSRRTTGVFMKPYAGTITSKFGPRSVSVGSSDHKGIDISGPYGAPVAAADGGTVTFSGQQTGYGNLVVISHGDGFETAYGHCSELLVSAGQVVGKGETIARIGSTGTSSGNHVHFEVRVDGDKKNPLEFLN